jgi:hypothetical protein
MTRTYSLFALLVAAFAFAWPHGAARAQGCGAQNPNCIVVTMPTADASNRAASDAFVHNVAASLPTPATIYTGISGDCTATSLGVITCLKTNGTPFGTLAVQNASSVAITGGTITGMPTPTNASDVANKSYVDGHTPANFTGDNPPAAGTAGLVPAPPSGATAANELLGANGSWTQRKPLLQFIVPTPLQSVGSMPNNFVTAPAPIANIGNSGPGSTTMTTTPSDVFATILRNSGITGGASAYVDPVNGTDTGSTCAQATPCKTLQYCFANCTALNIVGVPTGPFAPFTYDSAATATRVHRLTFSGPASIRLNGSPYIDPSAMTFTATSTPSVYSATLSLTGSQAVQRITRNDVYDAGTGNLFRLQNYSSLAALQAASGASPSTVAGWFYGGGVLSIAYFGANVNTARAAFNAYYLDTTGNSSIFANNNVFLLIDALYQLDLEGTSIQGISSTTNYGTVLIEGRGLVRQFVASGNGFHMTGGFFYAAGVDCEAAQFDCFNFDPAANGTKTMAIGYNLKGWYAGDLETFPTTGGAGVAASNGWSAHGGVNDIVVASSFGMNYGPNVANAVAGTFTDSTWLVGVETVNSQGNLNAQANAQAISMLGDNTMPSASRTAWIDTCSTLSEPTSLFALFSNATIKYTNCSMNVPPTTQNGGVITTYTRNSP